MALGQTILMAGALLCVASANPAPRWLLPFSDDSGRSGGFPKFPSSGSQTSSSASSQCGTRAVTHPGARPKIIGGSSVPYGAYPWQVEIQWWSGSRWEHHCGGAVVGERLVLTAAHCLANLDRPSQIRVVAGQHSLSSRDRHERAYRIERFISHPDFRKAGPHSNDIALIKVRATDDAGIDFNSYVRPICLPSQDYVPADGENCIVSGWGAQTPEEDAGLSGELRAAWVPVLDQETCRREGVYGGRAQHILDSMLCAGLLDGGVDACRGDSGGPLSCPISQGRFVIAGVVSWGDGCAKKNRPGVYTRVAHFLPWLHQTARSLGVDL